MLKRLVPGTLLLALLTMTCSAVNAAEAPKAAAASAPASQKASKNSEEQHPHIRASVRELREARRELETAAHDFGGHRKEAIEAVDNAIRQLEQALQFDKK